MHVIRGVSICLDIGVIRYVSICVYMGVIRRVIMSIYRGVYIDVIMGVSTSVIRSGFGAMFRDEFGDATVGIVRDKWGVLGSH